MLRLPLPCLLLLSAGSLRAGLKFDRPVSDTIAPAAATHCDLDFAFVNEGPEPVTIERAATDCGCVTVQIKDEKRTYQPGEKGVIRGHVALDGVDAVLDKSLEVFLKGGSPNRPAHTLRLKVTLQQAVAIEPKTLTWEQGEALTPKTAEMVVDAAAPVHPGEISASEDFLCEVTTVEDGRKYRLTVTPKSTAASAFATFAIATDCPIPRYRVQRLFAVVKTSSAEPRRE